MTNIVLITIDCLRADHMSCYGYKRNTTPFIDKISEKGILFENAFANGPNTRHSVPSFLTSTYPLLFKQEALGEKLNNARKSIAEVLKEKNYYTAAIHSNPYISKFYGYDKGFEYFNDFLLGQVEDDKNVNNLFKIFNELLKGLKALIIKKLPHEDADTINNDAIRCLENKPDKNFFLWVHYMDVHMPYIPQNKYLDELNLKTYNHIKKIWLGKKIDDVEMRNNIRKDEIDDYINLYDACIRYTDFKIKELISNIEKRYSNTIFIITADHGEEFREHNDLSHLEKLYDELLHIPIVIYGENIISQKVDKIVSLIDLAPTILKYLNIKNYKWFQGTNFFESKDYIISEAWKDKKIISYRDKEWKYIFEDNKKQLFNLIEDKYEKNNLAYDNNYKDLIKKFDDLINIHNINLEKEMRKIKTWIQKEKIKKSIPKIKLK